MLRARVKQGRLTLDEPTDLPEGAEIDLVVVPPEGAPSGAGHAEHAEGARFLAPDEAADEPAPPSEGAAADAIIEQAQRQARG